MFKSLTLFIFASLKVDVAHVHSTTILLVIYIYFFCQSTSVFSVIIIIIIIVVVVFNRNRRNFSMPLQCHFIDIRYVVLSYKMCPIVFLLSKLYWIMKLTKNSMFKTLSTVETKAAALNIQRVFFSFAFDSLPYTVNNIRTKKTVFRL